MIADSNGGGSGIDDDDYGGFKTTFLCHFVNQINSRGVILGGDPLSYSIPLLLLQLSLISIITRVVQFLLKPFGQPFIVSQILGGVILGPSILGQNVTFLERVFPAKGRVVIDTLSIFGLMLFIFLIGVKVDPTMVLRSGKKAIAVGILGFFIPYGLASLVACLLDQFLSLDTGIAKALPHLVVMQSMTAFPVITCFLDELNILNSEIGRLASSSSIICDVCLWSVMSIQFAVKIYNTKPLRVTIGLFLSSIFFSIFIVFGVRPAASWAIRRTPEGKPIKEIYVFMVLVVLMACGFAGEVIGINALVASLAFGLVIPDGPPLGAALVERLDCFVSALLMPLFFTICGLHMDIFCVQKLKDVGVLQLIVFVAFVGKIMGTMLPLLFCRMPFRDALSFALIMNSKGIVELAFLNDFRISAVITRECYAISIISVVGITGVIAPLVKVLYDPSKRYVAYKRRTLLHSRNDEELRILACVHSQENVPAILGLLQVSNPTKDSPINLVVLHLNKLMGRASSVLVAHRERDKPLNPTQSERIFNAFKKFEEQYQGLVLMQCYKAISPYATMHDDVCLLALEKRTILIIIPFHEQWILGQRVETSYAYRHLNKNVLEKAPCSVGILINRGNQKKSRYVATQPSLFHVAVLFLGGADDREALAYACRMADKPNVMLTVVRFRGSNSTGIVGGTERSKMLDAEILGGIKLKMQIKRQILSQEYVATSGEDVLSITRRVGSSYDLVMVGRRHGNSPIMSELRKWNQRGELGAIGEIFAASDFRGEASVLVVQQQTKLWGLKDPEESTHLRRIKL
ncbi:cation/H(+) antiporter 15-like isoform X1 [Coffea arabica]|uniref:Cation/H(+) antiporter 15-like isoform X1 n=1 Tax=Coffea arabica TaxID=13443 RepID=A0ABM4WWE8_COFAR